MTTKYETAGGCPLPEDGYAYKSPMDEYIRSSEAPTLAEVARKWNVSGKYIKVISADSDWPSKRREYQDAEDVANVPEGEPRLCREDRDTLKALTYDLQNGNLTLDQFRIQLFPPIMRGLIALSGSGSADTAHRALSDISKLIAARPTDAPEAVSRHERTRPETLEDWFKQLESGSMPDELAKDY